MDTIGEPADVVRRMTEALNPLVEGALLLEPDRMGGFFSVWFVHSGALLTPSVQMARVRPEKYDKYYNFSREKPARLAKNPRHKLSSESRNPDADQYGGAFRAGKEYILGFSGFSEELDEALMLALACVLELSTFNECNHALDKTKLDRKKVFESFVYLIKC